MYVQGAAITIRISGHEVISYEKIKTIYGNNFFLFKT